MHVIGTAGHVDHGKSTLVAALSGTHPDRLKEEQEREMTIDLGFAWLTLPGGEEVGIVDVPGHRDFIENMLAGVGGIDAAMLVIAADEGLMPQTREHLSILDLLQVKAGLVVLSKIDLVDDPEWLELVEVDIRNILRDTVLQNAPILRISSRSRAGLPELLNCLSLIIKNLPPRSNLGRPRLPIDRVFSIAGFGTVVTGTLTDGNLATGSEVELLPSGLHGRIRGLQTHQNKEEVALPGSRTAVNISGLDVAQITRGDVVTYPGQYQATQRLDLSFRLLPEVSSPLRHHMEVKLYLGTSETIGNVRLLGVEALNPGETGWLQLDLHSPVVAVHGDRYILRRPSPGETLGGGMVVDAMPMSRHKRFDKAVLQTLDTMVKGAPAEVILQACFSIGPSPVKDVIARSGLESSSAETGVKDLIDTGQGFLLEDLLIATSEWERLKKTVGSTLSAYHDDNPLRRGMPREELKSRLKMMPRFFNLAMKKMAAEGILTENPRWIAHSGHVVRFSPFQQVKVDELNKMFASSPLAPPSVKDCTARVGDEVFNLLLESSDLVTVSVDIVFRKTDYDAMVEKIHQEIQQKGKITLAEVRDLLNTSRKYVQALLEHLDSLGVTERVGDFRKLK